MKTDKENWDELVEREAKRLYSEDRENKTDNGLMALTSLWKFKAGVAFARTNVNKIPEVKELVEAAQLAKSRSLDWDMMSSEDSLRELQNMRGKLFDALQKLEG